MLTVTSSLDRSMPSWRHHTCKQTRPALAIHAQGDSFSRQKRAQLEHLTLANKQDQRLPYMLTMISTFDRSMPSWRHHACKQTRPALAAHAHGDIYSGQEHASRKHYACKQPRPALATHAHGDIYSGLKHAQVETSCVQANKTSASQTC